MVRWNNYEHASNLCHLSVVIQGLLSSIPNQHEDLVSYDSALGAALVGCLNSLVGHVLLLALPGETHLQIGRSWRSNRSFCKHLA